MKNKTKKRHRFIIWIIYGVFVLLLCIAAAFALRYVHGVVLEYDSAQPEKTTDEFLAELKSASDESYVPADYTESYLVGNEKYNVNADRSSLAYLRSGVGDGMSVRLAGSYPEGDVLYRKYTVQRDGRALGTLTLRGVNQRTKLFFFTMADWSIVKFEPVVSAEFYSVKIYMPGDIQAAVNGVAVSEDEIKKDGDVPYCRIDELLKEPTVTLTENGENVDFMLRDGVVYPMRYCYTLTLPEYIKVYMNGDPKEHDGSAGEKYRYSFAEMLEPVVEVEDETGYRKTVDLSAPDVSIYEYSVTVPETYGLTVGSYEPEPTGKTVPHKDADALAEYNGFSLPASVEYGFRSLDPDAGYVIHTGNGDVEMKGYTTVITDLFTSDALPSLASDIDVFGICKVWSDLMTGDLEGRENGFYNAAKYLVKDSSLYEYAYKWATGVDITFHWDHKILGVKDVSVTDYIKYSDTCFSCHVYFKKELYLYFNSGMHRDDIFDNIVYFIYVDDTDDKTDNPHWAIAAMHGPEAENESA